ncbi:hypothetical protein D9757_008699 [Collybiopsis confluens]|uniref:Uncharacterized protein n=1 Tax=Collybiopsis confluens TaxID=2823264 RepID=A0A8H5H8K5_9AGAR|nr:hypothetical protein D9757_008699 [Collybiopsis confluens]
MLPLYTYFVTFGTTATASDPSSPPTAIVPSTDSEWFLICRALLNLESIRIVGLYLLAGRKSIILSEYSFLLELGDSSDASNHGRKDTWYYIQKNVVPPRISYYHPCAEPYVEKYGAGCSSGSYIPKIADIKYEQKLQIVAESASTPYYVDSAPSPVSVYAVAPQPPISLNSEQISVPFSPATSLLNTRESTVLPPEYSSSSSSYGVSSNESPQVANGPGLAHEAHAVASDTYTNVTADVDVPPPGYLDSVPTAMTTQRQLPVLLRPAAAPPRQLPFRRISIGVSGSPAGPRPRPHPATNLARRNSAASSGGMLVAIPVAGPGPPRTPVSANDGNLTLQSMDTGLFDTTMSMSLAAPPPPTPNPEQYFQPPPVARNVSITLVGDSARPIPGPVPSSRPTATMQVFQPPIAQFSAMMMGDSVGSTLAPTLSDIDPSVGRRPNSMYQVVQSPAAQVSSSMMMMGGTAGPSSSPAHSVVDPLVGRRPNSMIQVMQLPSQMNIGSVPPSPLAPTPAATLPLTASMTPAQKLFASSKSTSSSPTINLSSPGSGRPMISATAVSASAYNHDSNPINSFYTTGVEQSLQQSLQQHQQRPPQHLGVGHSVRGRRSSSFTGNQLHSTASLPQSSSSSSYGSSQIVDRYNNLKSSSVPGPSSNLDTGFGPPSTPSFTLVARPPSLSQQAEQSTVDQTPAIVLPASYQPSPLPPPPLFPSSTFGPMPMPVPSPVPNYNLVPPPPPVLNVHANSGPPPLVHHYPPQHPSYSGPGPASAPYAMPPPNVVPQALPNQHPAPSSAPVAMAAGPSSYPQESHPTTGNGGDDSHSGTLHSIAEAAKPYGKVAADAAIKAGVRYGTELVVKSVLQSIIS